MKPLCLALSGLGVLRAKVILLECNRLIKRVPTVMIDLLQAILAAVQEAHPLPPSQCQRTWQTQGPCWTSDYDYDYIMAPQRGRPYGANLGSMGRNTGTWSIRSECLSNITSWSRRKGIEDMTLPFIPE